VLVCSNFHWLADRLAWNGGLLTADHNLPLLLNFAASAAAVREGRD
jgi:hypothetical protein